MASASENRPTVLLVGRGEPLDAALRVALDRHGMFVEEGSGELRSAVKMIAPDLILLLGDAAHEGGRAALDLLATDAFTASVPVAVLGPPEAFDARVRAFRHGAVAVIPRIASADAIAVHVASVTADLAERGPRPEDLGEATLDDLVALVGRELRNGILTVEPAQKQDREGQPLRIVLGAGRPVAAAVEEFVRKLAPLVSRAEPLVYELHQGPGGAVALLDGEGDGPHDVRIFEGLRVLVVDSDPSRADALAQELRARKAVVAVADAGGAGIERARALDPDVVLVDTLGIEGPGFEVIRRIRADHRLRWASLLVVPWDELWPSPEGAPDVARLAEQIEPLVVPDRVLRERAEKERAFETRLEATGPSRLLRALAALVGPFHVSVRSPKALVELDVAEGLVVGATGATAKGERLEGARALAALLALGSGRARVELRSHAATANLMVPVDQALSLADRESSPVPHTIPPPSALALEVAKNERRSDRSGPYRALGTPRTRAQPQAGRVADQDLRWTDTMDSSWKDSEPTRPLPLEERTKEIEVPSVPPGVARSSLPTGIVGVVTESSVMAPLPKPAAAARRSAFASSSIGAVGRAPAKPQGKAPEGKPPEGRPPSGKTVDVHAETTARPGEVKRPSTRPAADRTSGLFSDDAEPGAHSSRAPDRRGIPSGAFTSSAGMRAAPPGASPRPPAITPVAVPIVQPPKASAGRTLAFGTAAPSTPPQELVSARFPRHARTVLGITGEPVSAPVEPPTRPISSPEAAARAKAVPPPAAPPVPPPAPAIGRAAQRAVTPPPADRRWADEPEADLSDVLRSGLPTLPTPDDAPGTVAAGEDPEQAVDDVLATLGSLPLETPRAAPVKIDARPITPEDFLAHEPSAANEETTAARPLVDLLAASSAPVNAFAQTMTMSALSAVASQPPPALEERPSAAPSPPPTPPTQTPVAPTSHAEPVAAHEPAEGLAGVTVRDVAVQPAAPRRGSAARVVLGVVGVAALALAGVVGARALGALPQLPWPAGLPDPQSVVATSTPPTTPTEVPPTPTEATPTEPTPTEPTPTEATPTEATPEPTPTEATPTEPTPTEPTPTEPTPTEATPAEPTPTEPTEPTPTEPTPTEATPTETGEPADGDDAASLVRQAEASRDSATRERLYRRVLELDARNHYAMIGLAEVLMGRGQAGEAVPLIERAIQRRRNRAEYRVMLGDARRAAGDAAGAEAAWREALEIDPDQRTARQRLGQ